MKLLSRIDRFCNTGIKPDYRHWEIHLTRKLNLLTLIGILNVFITLIVLNVIGLPDFTPELLCTLAVGPFVIVLNKAKNYIWAGYLFYLIGIFLFYPVMLKMGMESLSILYYFPLLISLVQVFGRKETQKHLFIIAALFLL